MNENILLSIIIPTKNRSFYCLYAIKQILSLELDGVEVCVQDNSDTDALRNEINALKSTNVVYNYHPGLLSFVDNFSEAISISHGEYLCMIGDDDGILPNVLDYARKAKAEQIDAIIPEFNYVYFWPSKDKIVNNAEDGLLNMTKRPLSEREVDPYKALLRLLKDAAQDYTSLDIPRLYHGIVNRGVLEAVKAKTGVFFGGLTPDMYMAVALSMECKKVLRTSLSFTISGICPKSGSADSATGRHTGVLSEAPHFRGHTSYNWDEMIPSFYSVDTIWAETLIHALKDYRQDELIPKFNLSLFDAICIHRYPDFKPLILEHAKTNDITLISIRFSYLLFFLRKQSRRINRKIRTMMNVTRRKSNRYKNYITNIIDAWHEIQLFNAD